MSFHEGIFSFFSSNSNILLGGFGILAFVVFLIFWGFRTSGYWSGTWRQGRAVRRLGWRGRLLWRGLKAGVKGSRNLAKLSWKVGKHGSRLVRDAAKTVSYYMKEEQEVAAETLHQTSAAAASLEIADIIMKLAKAEINEHEKKRILEQRIREFVASLVALSDSRQVDENTKRFAIKLGEQITEALIELTNSDAFTVDIRRKSFDAINSLLKVVNTAETLARRIEARAKRDERRLIKFNDREIKDLKKELRRRAEQAQKTIEIAREALITSELQGTAAAERLAAADKRAIEENVSTLIQVLGQLHAMNKRMLGTINKIKRDIADALEGIKDAIDAWKQLEKAEKEVNELGRRIKNAAMTARANIKTINDEPVDDVIIRLAGNSAIIFNNMAEVSKRVLEIDNKMMLPVLDSLRQAMVKAYRAEEASRIANRYFAQLTKAQEQFTELAKGANLSREVDVVFAQEIKIEEMEQKIAAQEQSVQQTAKSIFIRALNVLNNSETIIVQHIDYLANNAELTKQTKAYVLNALQRIMQGMHEIKKQLNAEFQKQAAEYQAKLAAAQSQQTLERLAA